MIRTGLRVVPFELKHLEMLEPRNHEIWVWKELSELRENSPEALEFLKGKSYTVFKGDTVIACWGYIFLWKGVFDMWTIPSVHVPKYIKSYVIEIKHWISRFMEIYKAHRLQTTTLVDDSHRHWMKLLGFEYEGLMKKYAESGEDHLLWARTV